MFHRLAHLVGWYRGDVYTWWERDRELSTLMVGYRCRTCGTIEGVHAAPDWLYSNSRPPEAR